MKKILILLLLISPFMGCDLDKDFEEMNIDPTKGASLDVNTKMSGVLLRGAGTEYEMTVTKIIYFSQFNQYLVQNSFLPSMQPIMRVFGIVITAILLRQSKILSFSLRLMKVR
jgi:hypothetical protein